MDHSNYAAQKPLIRSQDGGRWPEASFPSPAAHSQPPASGVICHIRGFWGAGQELGGSGRRGPLPPLSSASEIGALKQE